MISPVRRCGCNSTLSFPRICVVRKLSAIVVSNQSNPRGATHFALRYCLSGCASFGLRGSAANLKMNPGPVPRHTEVSLPSLVGTTIVTWDACKLLVDYRYPENGADIETFIRVSSANLRTPHSFPILHLHRDRP